MIILIDGYNLLKQLFPKLKENLDKQKNQLIKQLGYYKNKKAPSIKDIILVFDGGPLRHASREIHSGIIIIYSGQSSDADTWITEFVEKNKEKELLLVTLDKRLISSCQKYGVSSLNVFDFYKILQNSLLENTENLITTTPEYNIIQKYQDNIDDYDYYFNEKAVDLLMEQACLTLEEEKKDEHDINQNLRKSKAQKMPKNEKHLYKKLKKL